MLRLTARQPVSLQHFTTNPHILQDQPGKDAFSPAALDEQNQTPYSCRTLIMITFLQCSKWQWGCPTSTPLKKGVCCRAWGDPGLPQIRLLDSKLQESSKVYVIPSPLIPGQCTLACIRHVVKKICEMNR